MRRPASIRSFLALGLSLGCALAVTDLRGQESEAAAAPTAKAEATPKAEPPAKTSVFTLRPSGLYEDLPEIGFSLTSMMLGGGEAPKSFYGLLDELDKLAKDEAATSLMLDLSGNASFNMAQLPELERSLRNLRRAGKKVVAYLENATPIDYQLASQCDRVLMAEMAMLDLRAPALSTMHWKDALDLLGVQMDVVRCGDFKGAVEPFVLPEMSQHLRSHYLAMIESFNKEHVRRIASGRNLDPKVVRELQGQRVFTSKQALAAKLVDRVVPWAGSRKALAIERGDDEFELKAAGTRKKREPVNPLAMLTELFAPKKSKAIADDCVAVLHLSGAITDGEKAAPGSIVSGPAVRAIQALAENEKVKGVVVRVNSPGGSATASERILLALKELANKKPVAVSMGSLAASGGYYVTCLGRPIFAEVGTLTGSIGVFGMKPNAGALMRRVGVRSELVALDETAGFDSIDRSWTDGEKSRMQSFVDEVYDQFVGHVMQSRRLKREEVLAIAGGRVWSGEQAVEKKLVDRIGGLQDAVELVASEAKLPAGHPVKHWPEPQDPFSALVGSFLESRVSTGELDAARFVLARVDDARSLVTLVREALAGGTPRVWAFLPPGLSVR